MSAYNFESAHCQAMTELMILIPDREQGHASAGLYLFFLFVVVIVLLLDTSCILI